MVISKHKYRVFCIDKILRQEQSNDANLKIEHRANIVKFIPKWRFINTGCRDAEQKEMFVCCEER